MSYDLSLVDKNGQCFEMPESKHIGGTMPMGGYTESDFNITYNYSWFYYNCLDKRKGLRWLYGKTGAQTIDRLEKAINKLGIDRYFEWTEGKKHNEMTEDDKHYRYWAPTPGNAGYALLPLLEAAKSFPDGVWQGD